MRQQASSPSATTNARQCALGRQSVKPSLLHTSRRRHVQEAISTSRPGGNARRDAHVSYSRDVRLSSIALGYRQALESQLAAEDPFWTSLPPDGEALDYPVVDMGEPEDGFISQVESELIHDGSPSSSNPCPACGFLSLSYVQISGNYENSFDGSCRCGKCNRMFSRHALQQIYALQTEHSRTCAGTQHLFEDDLINTATSVNERATIMTCCTCLLSVSINS